MWGTSTVWLLVSFFVAFRNVDSSLNIISSTGNLASKAKIENVLQGLSGNCKIVSAIGGRGCGKSSLLNEIFNVKLAVSLPLSPPSLSKACIEVSDGFTILDFEGPTGETSEIPMQAVSLASSISDVIIWNIWGSDIGRTASINIKTLKKLYSQKIASKGTKSLLLIAIHDCGAIFNLDRAKKSLLELFQSVWNDLEISDNSISINDIFDFEFVALPHPVYQGNEFKDACMGLRQRLKDQTFLKSEYSKNINVNDLFENLQKKWEEVKKIPTATTRADMMAQYNCNEAYGAVLLDVEEEIRSWKAIVGKGKVISNFGDRVARLLEQSLDTYSSETRANGNLQIREEKRKDLKNIVMVAANNLLNRQLATLQVESLASVKKALTRKISRKDALSVEERDACVREAAFKFECKANKLVHSDLDLDFSKAKAELDAELEETAAKFADSPAAKLQALKKLEKKVVKQPKGPRGMGFGFALTSMIRSNGDGNLQGFCNCRKGPHSITVGYANDRDSPDAVKEGEKPPYLRIQPKLNIDLDL